MNMKDIYIIDELLKLIRQLLAKNQFRSNYKNGFIGFGREPMLRIGNHHNSFTGTSRSDCEHLGVLSHQGEDFFLVRSQLNHLFCADKDIIAAKRGQ
jgi:hypothetical protein